MDDIYTMRLTLTPPSGGSAAMVSFLFAIISISWKYSIDGYNEPVIQGINKHDGFSLSQIQKITIQGFYHDHCTAKSEDEM